MEKYFCKCANVTINITSIKNTSIEGKDLLHIEDMEDMVRPFFKNRLIEVNLAVSGIEVAQSILLLQRSVSDWLVSLCLNCGCYTHATHGTDRVLIDENLDHGMSKYNEIQNSQSYSKIFKFKFVRNDEPYTALKINFKDLTKAYEQIEKLFKNAVSSEEEAMRERIRVFTAHQLQEFHDYKLKASKDKDTLKKTIKKFEDPDQYESSFDLITQNKNIVGESKDNFTNSPNKKIYSVGTNHLDASNISPTSQFPDSRSRNHLMQTSKDCSPLKQSDSNNEESLFDFEGFQESKSYEPFFESDDDSSGDTASLESSGGFNMQVTSQGINSSNRVYATSVPVSIQLFNNRKHSYEPDDENDLNELSPSPNHIAESIKALAKSVQDSTAMFGELPRTRFNTIPYSLR